MDEWDTFWAHGWAGQMDSSDFYTARPHGPNYYPCNWLWKSMAIYWDGKVPSCCADFGEDQIMGRSCRRIAARHLEQSRRIGQFARRMCSGKLDDYKLCRGCDAIWQEGGSTWNLFAGARGVVTGRFAARAPGRDPTARTSTNGTEAPGPLIRRRECHAPPSLTSAASAALSAVHGAVLASQQCASPLFRTFFRRRWADRLRTSTTWR